MFSLVQFVSIYFGVIFLWLIFEIFCVIDKIKNIYSKLIFIIFDIRLWMWNIRSPNILHTVCHKFRWHFFLFVTSRAARTVIKPYPRAKGKWSPSECVSQRRPSLMDRNGDNAEISRLLKGMSFASVKVNIISNLASIN